MTTVNGDLLRCQVFGHRLLFALDGGRRFNSDAHDDILARTDSTERAAGIIVTDANPIPFQDEGIIALGAAHAGLFESAADLHAFGGRHAEHRLPHQRVDFAVHRFAQPGWHTGGVNLDNASETIFLRLGGHDRVDHLLCSHRVSRTNDVLLDHITIDGFACDSADLLRPGKHLDAHGRDYLLCDDASCYAAPGFSCGGSTTTAMVAVTILLPIRVIGVPRAEYLPQVVIFGAICILIKGNDADGCTGSIALEYTGKDFGSIFLATRCGDLALANPTAIKVFLDILNRQRDAGWHAIDNHAERGTVALTPGGDAKNLAETAAHVCSASLGAAESNVPYI